MPEYVLWQAGLLLLLHGEVTSPDVDIFDREMVFIETILQPLLEQLPNLKVVLEHITTSHAVEFVESASENVAASITPQHMLLNRNALFQVSMLHGLMFLLHAPWECIADLFVDGAGGFAAACILLACS